MTRRTLALAAAVLALLGAGAAMIVTLHSTDKVPTPQAATLTYVGSEACAGCHREAWAQWQDSHHRHAMATASSDTVLGDFRDAQFTDGGVTSRFTRRDGQYWVTTDGPDGAQQTYPVAYTLGIEPLQQYLVQFPDGRLQALQIAWDSRPVSQGGQRWYSLHPGERLTPQDALHWTGAFQNASARCVGCHTTGFEKRFDADTQRYDSRWQEPHVGCEACHGAGSQHLTWAQGDRQSGDKGFATSLARAWSPQSGQRAIPTEPPQFTAQDRACAACHSRRAELQQPVPGTDFFDAYTLSPLLQGLYFDDGRMREEVYETGSFLQSRMHQNHVACSNCHEPHSAQLRVSGNGLCLQCHESSRFEVRAHHGATSQSASGQCISCHMPTRTYMGIDARHDHSLQVPGKSTAYARLLAGARRHDIRVTAELLAYIADEGQPAIRRATALLESSAVTSPEQQAMAQRSLASPDPLLRVAAVAAHAGLDPQQRLQQLSPLFNDPVKSVRMTLARQLADIPVAAAPAPLRTSLARLLDEYRDSLRYTADMPESLTDLALLQAAKGDATGALQALQRALQRSPRYLPALLNLADLHRAAARDDLAAPVLGQAVQLYPESAEAQHALGLLQVRSGRLADAVAPLRRAAQLSPDTPRYALAHALVLLETGQRSAGLSALRAAAARFPGDVALRDALTGYSQR